jgi:acid phosphatase family membrane protein YuiD
MDFLKLFLRGIALLPSLIQGVESLYGAKTGLQKKDAAIAIVSSSINMADAVSAKQIADSGKFTAGLNLIVDGVVECLNASIWAKS